MQDKISIRALQIYDGKVWYSGTDSKFGFVDLKDLKKQKQIKLSDNNLQFRTLAQDKNNFYAINVESPACFFKINKKSFVSKIIYTDASTTAFYDALRFINDKVAFAFSDSDDSKKLKLFIYNNDKWSHFKNPIILNEGEAAFAASNTNLVSSNNYLWIATGGKFSRIIRMNFKSNNFEVFKTPFIQGTSSTGIYSIDFYKDNFGIAVGGDYARQSDNVNNIATSIDKGETWQIQASGKNAGYMTCVKIRPGSKGKEIIAVGDQHISYSNDFGKSWTKISDEKNLYVFTWLDKNTLVFAGKDRILKAELSL
ncbi:WD40/YVTN/BNR-like repeat-containing protein [Halpernia sp. GG3]